MKNLKNLQIVSIKKRHQFKEKKKSLENKKSKLVSMNHQIKNLNLI